MAVTIAGLSGLTFGITTTEAGMNSMESSVEMTPEFRAELPDITGEIKAVAIGPAKATVTVRGEYTGSSGWTVIAACTIVITASSGTFTSAGGFYLTRGTISLNRSGWKSVEATFEAVDGVA